PAPVGRTISKTIASRMAALNDASSQKARFQKFGLPVARPSPFPLSSSDFPPSFITLPLINLLPPLISLFSLPWLISFPSPIALPFLALPALMPGFPLLLLPFPRSRQASVRRRAAPGRRPSRREKTSVPHAAPPCCP